MGSKEDYLALAAGAGFVLSDYEDIQPRGPPDLVDLRGGAGGKKARDRTTPSAASPSPARRRNRSFMLSVPRLIIALRTGAMRYGVFAWEMPI